MGGICTRNGGCGKVCVGGRQGTGVDWDNPADNSTRGLVAQEKPTFPVQSAMITPRARSRLPGLQGSAVNICSPKIAGAALVFIAAIVVVSVLSIPILAIFVGPETTTTTKTTTSTMTNTTTSSTLTTSSSVTTTSTRTSTTMTTPTTTNVRTTTPMSIVETTGSHTAIAIAAADAGKTTTWGGYAGGTSVQNLFETTTSLAPVSTTTALRTVSLSATLKNLDYNRLMEDQDICADFKSRVKGAIVSEVGIYGIGQDNVELTLNGGSVIVWATLQTVTVTAEVVRRGLNASRTTLGRRLEASVKSVSGIELLSTGEITASDIRILSPDETLSGSKEAVFFIPVVVGGLCFCVVAICAACVVTRRELPNKQKGYNLAQPSRADEMNGGADGVRSAASPSAERSKEEVEREFMHREFLATAGDMGFAREIALATLARANNDTDAALDLLLAEQ